MSAAENSPNLGKILEISPFPWFINHQPARSSRLSPLPFKLVLIPLKFLGEHEQWTADGLKAVDYTPGFAGPPLVVAHAQSDDWYHQLPLGTSVYHPAYYGKIGNGDGHHRLQLARASGFHWLPAYPVPLRDARVIIDTWDGKPPVTKDQICQLFTNPNQVLSPTTTKWKFQGLDGQIRRAMEFLPNVFIPADHLRIPLEKIFF